MLTSVWTWDDLAGARAETNATARPWCEQSASPDEVWSARTPIMTEVRMAFDAAVTTARKAQSASSGTCAPNDAGVISEASVSRSAIKLAFVECGYLQYRSRSVPPPIKHQKMD